MTSHTTTAEAPSAEIPLLMVMPLSLYEQLENVDYDKIAPFGRVRPKGTSPRCVYVIGEEIGQGDLVRSSLDNIQGDPDRRGMAAEWRALPWIVLADL